jgi:PAS domain S-box-containing protein
LHDFTGIIRRPFIDDPQAAGLLGEVSDFGIFALDTNGICTVWNPISSNYQLAPANEVVGHALEKFYGPEERKTGTYWKNLEIAKEKGRCDTEGLRRRWDGSYSWTRISIVRKLNDNGAHVGYLGVVYDATRQRDAARALHASEEAFRSLVLGLHDHAICPLNIDGRVTNWNAGAEQINGYTADEAVGQHFSIFFTEEERGCGVPDQVLEQARVAGRYREEGWRVRQNGEAFRAEIFIQTLYDESGEIHGFGSITRDITEQYQAKQKLAAAEEALNQSKSSVHWAS